MKRPLVPAAPKAKSLPQQNADFTAEGSPPPGKVAGAVVPKLPKFRAAPSRTPAGIPGAHRRAPTGKPR
jgi:hypothetical protein